MSATSDSFGRFNFSIREGGQEGRFFFRFGEHFGSRARQILPAEMGWLSGSWGVVETAPSAMLSV
jgi:hypothetical protein